MPISSLAVTGSSRKILRGPTPKASLHLLHISVPNSLVVAREVSRNWTLHNDDGDVISLDGHRARRPLRYFMNSLPDNLCVSTSRALALFGRLHSLSSGTRMPLPATIFTLSLHTPNTWTHWCPSLLQHHATRDPGPRCSLTTRRWLQRVRRLWRRLALLSNVRFIPGVVRPHMFNRRHTTPASILAWFNGGDSPDMATIHAQVDGQPGTMPSCAFCTSPVGDLLNSAQPPERLMMFPFLSSIIKHFRTMVCTFHLSGNFQIF